jgi:hypothetical protein
MEDLILGNLIVSTSVVIPHPNNVRLGKTYSVDQLQYRYKTVKLQNYFGIERNECFRLKAEFLAHNKQFDEGDLQFTFQLTEYL